jgi:hypothetical protein
VPQWGEIPPSLVFVHIPVSGHTVALLVLDLGFVHVVVIEHLADEEQFQKSDILSTL